MSRGAGRQPVLHELRVLVGFRLRTGGHEPRQTVLVASAVTLLLGAVLPLAVAAWAPRAPASELVGLSPSLWFAFLLLVVGTSLASGGGRELMPRGAGAVFPVSPAADQAGALLMTPLNLAWSVQATLVVTTTAYSAGPGWRGVAALLAAWAWVVCATTLAQLVGWSAGRLVGSGPSATVRPRWSRSRRSSSGPVRCCSPRRSWGPCCPGCRPCRCTWRRWRVVRRPG